uniref:Uncharacterized protein n=1 Tax=Neogobius melanostomus TaxID=47308 RepID=A0A8C6V019_9GOBI
MVLYAVSRHLLRNCSALGAWILQRQSSGWVYSSSHDLYKQDSGIALLTVNNPSRMNAFSGSMMVDLEARVTELENWSDGKGLIVHGVADTFCSGSDLNVVRLVIACDFV